MCLYLALSLYKTCGAISRMMQPAKGPVLSSFFLHFRSIYHSLRRHKFCTYTTNIAWLSSQTFSYISIIKLSLLYNIMAWNARIWLGYKRKDVGFCFRWKIKIHEIHRHCLVVRPCIFDQVRRPSFLRWGEFYSGMLVWREIFLFIRFIHCT